MGVELFYYHPYPSPVIFLDPLLADIRLFVKDAVDEKLSTSLYPYASQRSGGSALSSKGM